VQCTPPLRLFPLHWRVPCVGIATLFCRRAGSVTAPRCFGSSLAVSRAKSHSSAPSGSSRIQTKFIPRFSFVVPVCLPQMPTAYITTDEFSNYRANLCHCTDIQQRAAEHTVGSWSISVYARCVQTTVKSHYRPAESTPAMDCNIWEMLILVDRLSSPNIGGSGDGCGRHIRLFYVHRPRRSAGLPAPRWRDTRSVQRGRPGSSSTRAEPCHLFDPKLAEGCSMDVKLSTRISSSPT
jgi:hypothetical protein